MCFQNFEGWDLVDICGFYGNVGYIVGFELVGYMMQVLCKCVEWFDWCVVGFGVYCRYVYG